VLAHAVSRRTREIGVRMPLGARFGQLIALVMAGSFGLYGLTKKQAQVLAWPGYFINFRGETQREPAWQGGRSGSEPGCMWTSCPARNARPTQPGGLAASHSRKDMKYPG